MNSYSLVTEGWLPALSTAGAAEVLSLEDVFTRGATVQRLTGDTPRQTYALNRLLLAIYWSAHRRHPALSDSRDAERFESWLESEAERIDAGLPDEVTLKYLSERMERFDLIGPTPFMQVATLATASNKVDSPRRLIMEAESDQFQTIAGDALTSLPLDRAARALADLQSSDPSGIKSGAIGDPRVSAGKGFPIGPGWTGMTGGVFIHGDSLARSLMLNTVPRLVFGVNADQDLAPWDRSVATAAQRDDVTAQGAVNLLTWQARRVRLFLNEEGRVGGVLVANGDRIPDAGANIRDDPMTPYRHSLNKSKKGQPPVYYPRPFDADRTLWKALEPLLLREGVTVELRKGQLPTEPPATIRQLAELYEMGFVPRSLTPTLELTSVLYGSQSSVTTDTVSLELDIPFSALKQDHPLTAQIIIDEARLTQEAAIKVGQFAGQLLRAAGKEYEFVSGPTNALLNDLEADFRRWIMSLQTADPAERARVWNDRLMTAALSSAQRLMTSAGPRALVGRSYVDTQGKERFESAGTAYGLLEGQLKKLLSIPTVSGTVASDSQNTEAKSA